MLQEDERQQMVLIWVRAQRATQHLGGAQQVPLELRETVT
ncbi:hypothetical protein QF035_008960 [Streptomyces umbrinus]|uniref:Uncharacterized protein n=1 Tax=Streptomyces umbrinus TaxID=67370 RepID=A0ABU0T6D8_9ACTN|nr:hypothetical protein [Streptomyces umbrinus]